MKLQCIPHTITKAIQLYETKNSRHSTMLLGPTLSGKTVCWKLLQAAMTKLFRDGDKDMHRVRVSISVLITYDIRCNYYITKSFEYHCGCEYYTTRPFEYHHRCKYYTSRLFENHCRCEYY